MLGRAVFLTEVKAFLGDMGVYSRGKGRKFAGYRLQTMRVSWCERRTIYQRRPRCHLALSLPTSVLARSSAFVVQCSSHFQALLLAVTGLTWLLPLEIRALWLVLSRILCNFQASCSLQSLCFFMWVFTLSGSSPFAFSETSKANCSLLLRLLLLRIHPLWLVSFFHYQQILCSTAPFCWDCKLSGLFPCFLSAASKPTCQLLPCSRAFFLLVLSEPRCSILLFLVCSVPGSWVHFPFFFFGFLGHIPSSSCEGFLGPYPGNMCLGLLSPFPVGVSSCLSNVCSVS